MHSSGSVTVVCDGYPPQHGGGEATNAHIVAAVERAGFEARVIAVMREKPETGTSTPFASVAGVRIAAPRALREKLAEPGERVRILVGPSINNLLAAGESGAAPTIVFYHADLDWTGAPGRLLGPPFFAWLRRGAALTVTTTAPMASRLAERGIRRLRTHALGADEPLRAPLADRDESIAFVGGFGRGHAYKRLDLLIAAMTGPELATARLDVIGDGPADRMRGMAGRYGVSDRVRFHGRVDDETRRALVARAKVFVMPSPTEREGFSLASLEALRCGTPAVVGARCGAADFVARSGFGATWAGTRPRALATAIGHVLRWSGDERLERFRGFAAISDDYRWERFERELAATIAEVARAR